MSERGFSRREFMRRCSAGAAAAGISGCSRGQGQSAPRFPADPETQNSLVSQAAVEAVLDGLAVALTRIDSAPLAWEALFNFPTRRDRSTLLAAIKTNEVGSNRPRAAVVAKVCRALIACGLQAGNICVYAGNERLGEDDPYGRVLRNTVPAGVVVGRRQALLGGFVFTDIPAATKNQTVVTSARCIEAVAKRQIDLLINIAVNKGHWDEFGGCTLTMKNHFGTFDPQPYGGSGIFSLSHGNFDYLLAINQSEALLGGELPLQRLCIVDSIWAGSEPNPGAEGDAVPLNRMVMGTFSPVVDFVTMKCIRHEIMGCPFGRPLEAGLWQLGFSRATTAALACIDVDADQPQRAAGLGDLTSERSHRVHAGISDLRVARCHDQRMVLFDKPG